MLMGSAAQEAMKPCWQQASERTPNPYAVALADRDIPGPVVDTSHQRIAAELLSVADLDAASRRYHVQFVLVDGARLPSVPGFTAWLNKNYSPARYLSDGAALYAR